MPFKKWKSSLLLLLATAALLAQTGSRSMEADMRRVGSRLACLCGCTHTVATCDMFECGFAKPAKHRIIELQTAGISDQAIVDMFVKEHGQRIFRAEPSRWGWLVPYLALIPGLMLVFWFVRRYYRRPAVAGGAPPLDDGEYSRYREQIEKDVARLD